MDDPIAFFLTVATYGTWLPGDSRGWVDYRRGWQLPRPVHELEARARMTEQACLLGGSQRTLVEYQIADTCCHRGWTLHAVNCRSNHLHAVIGASNTTPKQIRRDIKAWSTRRLKECVDSTRDNWWAERGSIRRIFDESSLEQVVLYVLEAQNRMNLEK
jgi:REP element-mobilizing transposase RayT